MPQFRGLAHYGIAGIAFQWAILTLALFRITRFVTTDTFPPMAAIRNRIVKTLGKDWGELIICNWCVGFYLCTLAYLLLAQMFPIPLPVVQAFASMGVIGFVGNYDD